MPSEAKIPEKYIRDKRKGEKNEKKIYKREFLPRGLVTPAARSGKIVIIRNEQAVLWCELQENALRGILEWHCEKSHTPSFQLIHTSL